MSLVVLEEQEEVQGVHPVVLDGDHLEERWWLEWIDSIWVINLWVKDESDLKFKAECDLLSSTPSLSEKAEHPQRGPFRTQKQHL